MASYHQNKEESKLRKILFSSTLVACYLKPPFFISACTKVCSHFKGPHAKEGFSGASGKPLVLSNHEPIPSGVDLITFYCCSAHISVKTGSKNTHGDWGEC